VVAGLLLEFAAMSKSVEKKGCLVARLTTLGEQGLIHICICMQNMSVSNTVPFCIQDWLLYEVAKSIS
jgi:hypothetical protein